MSRKKKAPKRISYPDTKYGSLVLSKFVNFIKSVINKRKNTKRPNENF